MQVATQKQMGMGHSALRLRAPYKTGLGMILLTAGLVALGVVAALSGTLGALQASPRSATLSHRLVYHVGSNDPAAMQHALSSADNAIKAYRSRGEAVTVEIVANGGGVHMMRADTTPVGSMLRYMREAYPDLVLTACGNTQSIMEAREGRTLAFVDGVRVVPAGIVRLIELQEQGYAYVKP